MQNTQYFARNQMHQYKDQYFASEQHYVNTQNLSAAERKLTKTVAQFFTLHIHMQYGIVDLAHYTCFLEHLATFVA